MTTATAPRSFLDSAIIRLFSLILAGLIAYLFYNQWGSEIGALIRGQSAPMATVKAPAHEATPALDACLTRRVGDVENMKSENVINSAQYTKFKARAIALCHAQNPGSVAPQ